MKPVTMFILKSCPYCQQAAAWMEEVREENPEYSNVIVNVIDEGDHPEVSEKYDYYYVPTYYIAEEKVHEGAATKAIVKNVFEKASE